LTNAEIKLFEEKKVRRVWDAEKEQWYFSIIDIIEALTGTDRPRKYWSDLKVKLKKEGSELSENIGQLKMQSSDGKLRDTDVANPEQLLRLIQTIPSPKAEPFEGIMVNAELLMVNKKEREMNRVSHQTIIDN
jgi:DNA-damage-inducible protein D